MMTHSLFGALTNKFLLTFCVHILLKGIAPSHAEYSLKVRVSSDWDTLCKLYISSHEVSVEPFLKSTQMMEMQCIKTCWDYCGCMAVSLYQSQCFVCSTSKSSTFVEVTSQVTGPLNIYQLLLREEDFYLQAKNCTSGSKDWYTSPKYFNHKYEHCPVSSIQFCRDVGDRNNVFEGIVAGMKVYYGKSHQGW